MARRLKSPPEATRAEGLYPAPVSDMPGQTAEGSVQADRAAKGDDAAQVRRRWLPGQSRSVRPANALQDVDLLVRVRDCLKELPDDPSPATGAGNGGRAGEPAGSPRTSGSPRTTGHGDAAAQAVHRLAAGQGGAEGSARTTGPAVVTGKPPAARARQPADPVPSAIRETFDLVAAAGDMATSYFYGWLFASNPELRDLFPPAMDEQRDRLFRALTRIVESLTTPDDMTTYLAGLGRDHRKYDVRPEMYPAVGEALIATLRAFAGRAFTPEAEEAWARTYAVAAEVMVKAANEASARLPARWPGEVVEHEKRGRDIAVLTVATDQALPYQAGQHVTVQTRRWPKVWRPLSVACRPREDGLLRFHVKAVSGGWVSTALVEHTAVGDPLVIGPAVGSMTLAAAGGRDLLCVAGGTGLAPLKAIAEQAIYEDSRQRRHRNVLLFCGARTRGELYDLPGLWHLADAYPWLQVNPVTSDDPGYEGMQGNVGRVAARYMPQSELDAFVSGPAQMVRDTIRALTKAGLPEQRIHFDEGVLANRRLASGGT